MEHECIERFKTEKIDECSGEGYNRCSGIYPMTLEVYVQDQNGLEDFSDNWRIVVVNFCPFCGMKSEPTCLKETR